MKNAKEEVFFIIFAKSGTGFSVSIPIGRALDRVEKMIKKQFRGLP
jgi:hypothetical protein